MIVYHTTTRKSLESILASGLDPACATRGRRAVWFVAESKIGWSISHVCRAKGASIEDAVTLAVEVDVDFLHTYQVGIYWCPAVIPPALIREVREYGVVSRTVFRGPTA